METLGVDNPDDDEAEIALGLMIDSGSAEVAAGASAEEAEAARAEGTEAAQSAPAISVASAGVASSGDELGEDAEAFDDAIGGPTEEEAAFVVARVSGPQILTHVVQKGETLTRIAAQYGIDSNTILAANDLIDANVLTVGQKLSILTEPGAIHSVKRGESLWEIARMYQTDIDTIARVNQLSDPGRIRPQQQLVIPGVQAANIGSAIRSEQLLSADGKLLRAFSWPVTGRISSHYGPRWGRMHHGLDIAVNTGTPVKAAAKGRVSFAGNNGGYGLLVIIDHGNGVETRYAHNSRINVKVGQYVSRGDVVALSGNTGSSTGPHVHFEIRLKGNSVNPLNYLR